MTIHINNPRASPQEGVLVDDDAIDESPMIQAGPSLKVLMVEDNEADAYLIERALRSHPRVGEIVHVRDGVQAVELIDAQQFQPDLALLDLQMPRKDGFRLLLELSLGAKADFPKVVLSSSRGGADRVRARIRGSAQFVTKPNSLEKMTEALGEVIATI
jgi:CheY-like chemotaxis protein